jgi:hypothetical protein
MPKRPREHILEDLARAALLEAFASVGWTTEDLDEDYGEDMLVRIFDENAATPFAFFIQSKATDHIERFMAREGDHLSFSVKSEHAEHWGQFWEPVVLAVYDAKSKQTYWEVIQTFLESKASQSAGSAARSIHVQVPLENRMDVEGLKRLKNRTKRRFARFELQQEGAKVLIDALKEMWGVEIIYCPEEGILIVPIGQFVADSSGGRRLTAFGRYAVRLEAMQRKFAVPPEHYVERSLDVMRQVEDGFKSGRILQVRDRDGSVIKEWQTLEDLFRHVEREEELEDD